MDEQLIPNFSVQEFVSFVAENYDQEIAAEFEINKISGRIFMKLSEDQLGKMVPAIGDVIELQSLQCRLKEMSTQPTQVHIALLLDVDS